MINSALIDAMKSITYIDNAMINKAIDKDFDIVGKIFEEMITDTENESSRLLKTYREADRREKAIIDTVIMNLCGWSLATLIKEKA